MTTLSGPRLSDAPEAGSLFASFYACINDLGLRFIPAMPLYCSICKKPYDAPGRGRRWESCPACRSKRYSASAKARWKRHRRRLSLPVGEPAGPLPDLDALMAAVEAASERALRCVQAVKAAPVAGTAERPFLKPDHVREVILQPAPPRSARQGFQKPSDWPSFPPSTGKAPRR